MATTSVDLFVATMRAFHLERAAVCDGEAEPFGIIQRELLITHMAVANIYESIARIGDGASRYQLEYARDTLNEFHEQAQQVWYEEHDQHALIAADIYAAASTQITMFLDR